MFLDGSWDKSLQAVSQMRDKTGMPVDELIAETVAALRFLGFSTISSCSGHSNKHTGGPFVNIESPKAASFAAKARKISDFKNEEYVRLRKKANLYRAQDLEKLLFYIDDFYQNNKTTSTNRIIVMSLPMSINVLCCQGADVAQIMDPAVKEELILGNQLEFKKFTDFLKRDR